MRDRAHMSLDAATVSGMCVGVPFGIPHTETWRLKGKSRGERYVDLRARMIGVITRFEPAVCFIEEPLPARVLVDIGCTLDTQMFLSGVVALAEATCAQYDVQTILVERKLALGHFTGRERYAKKEDAKKACVTRCHQLKYPIDGYDSADAAAQWDYGCARLYANAYAMIRAQLPATLKGFDDVQLPGSRGFARRRKPRPKRSPSLFDTDAG